MLHHALQDYSILKEYVEHVPLIAKLALLAQNVSLARINFIRPQAAVIWMLTAHLITIKNLQDQLYAMGAPLIVVNAINLVNNASAPTNSNAYLVRVEQFSWTVNAAKNVLMAMS